MMMGALTCSSNQSVGVKASLALLLVEILVSFHPKEKGIHFPVKSSIPLHKAIVYV